MCCARLFYELFCVVTGKKKTTFTAIYKADIYESPSTIVNNVPSRKALYHHFVQYSSSVV